MFEDAEFAEFRGVATKHLTEQGSMLKNRRLG